MPDPSGVDISPAQIAAYSEHALLQRARKAVALAPLATLFLGYVALDFVRSERVLAWMVLNSLPDLLLYWFCVRGQTALLPPQPRPGRSRLALALRGLQGLTWGSAALVFHIPGPNAALQDLMVLGVLVAVAAPSVINMAPSFRTLAVFCACCLLPPCLLYASLGDGVHLRFAVGLLMLYAVLLLFGHDAYRQFHDGVRELLRNQALLQRLDALSHTDGLTGIANRRRFDQTLATEWARARRSGTPLAVLMIDVDLFKKYNDRYGHQAGDACLLRLAQSLASGMRRASDLVARYGGEEFVVIAPDCDAARAQELANALRLRIQALDMAHADSPFGTVTVSIGAAVQCPSASGQLVQLVQRADEALYRDKNAGRNQVALSSQAPAAAA